MLREASACGLLIDPDVASATLGGDLGYAKPMFNSTMHNSLTPLWWLGEFWPKWTKRRVSPPGQSPEKFRGAPRLNLFRRRTINANAKIHQSAIDRRNCDATYRPSNLPAVPIVECDPAASEYPIRLLVGQCVAVGIHALLRSNDTGIQMSPGEQYVLEAKGRWYDATISTGPDGYESPNLLFRLLEWLRRVSKGNWFALIGVIGTDDRNTFLIGNGINIPVKTGGILKCYANDLPFMYQNNSGFLTLTVERIR